MSHATFEGYPRLRGRAGIRNHLLIVNVTGLTDPAARRVASTVRGAVLVSNPFGMGLLTQDTAALARCQLGLARNPNVGATLVLGADPDRVASLTAEIRRDGGLADAVSLDDCGHDILTFTDLAVRRGMRLAVALSGARRVAVGYGDLCIGLECGRSDPTSGLAANPLVGAVTDRLIDAGGAAVFGETIEWLGCEPSLERRASTPRVARELIDAVLRRERLAIDDGIDLLGRNPNPTNIRAGLSSIEEKAIGGLLKTGRRTVTDLIAYGDPVPGPGLFAMDAAAATPESLTGFAAAGAQLILFTTGVGNSLVNSIAPTIKISGHPTACERLTEQIDFPCSALIDGTRSIEECAPALESLVLAVASGRLTFGEVLGDAVEVVSRFGPSL